ncbi:MAG: thioredoxin domain-containing protein [Croceibacterium sp.]
MKTIVVAALLAIAPVTAALGQNWLTTVAATDTGHRIGNPQAKTKLIEYVSYTCPHCGDFFREADGVLKAALIQPGKGSIEVRHVIRDVVDLAATVLVNCGDRSKFWGNHDMFFVRQDKWMTTQRLALPAQQRRWKSGPMPQRLQAVAGDLGFYEMMESRGYTRAQLDRCLTDGAAIDALIARSEAAADAHGVNSTPSFVVNGKLLSGVHTWTELQKAL